MPFLIVATHNTPLRVCVCIGACAGMVRAVHSKAAALRVERACLLAPPWVDVSSKGLYGYGHRDFLCLRCVLHGQACGCCTCLHVTQEGVFRITCVYVGARGWCE